MLAEVIERAPARSLARATASSRPSTKPGTEEAADPTSVPQRAEEARFLVVDDDTRTLRFVRDTLSASGYARLVTVELGELAHIIRSEKPRQVLLDLVLPGQDGIALMKQIPEISDLPVIFISGHGRDETVAAAFEATISSRLSRRRSWWRGLVSHAGGFCVATLGMAGALHAARNRTC